MTRRGRAPDDRMVTAPSREAWKRLGACTAAAALLQLDGTLITVALPTLAHSLKVSAASTSLVLSAYFASYALMLPAGGAVVDRFGPRRVALLGLALFAAGAAAGAVCSSLDALAATRVVQGAGAGLVSPAALAGAVSGFPPERRGGALGIWGASAGVSNLIGPLAGGLLTVSLGWRADWWALVPLALLAATAIVAQVPRIGSTQPATDAGPVASPIVLTAGFLAGVTFAVMIGSFYLAEQYLQRTARYSPLGASSVLVLVALFVGMAAPMAGRLADRRGERFPAMAGFLATGTGLLVLGLPGVSLRSAVTIAPLFVVGLGLGMLFVPVSRAALNATAPSAHGRTSAILSGGRLLGAAAGAGLAGLALAGGATAAAVHEALLVACALCLVIGVPAARLLPSAADRR
ncbi:MAG TPA: MFS transporter [Solirubrobacteraceae bacterium]|nr:MFS transporter [Solirubrobacteraceae bacterium]